MSVTGKVNASICAGRGLFMLIACRARDYGQNHSFDCYIKTLYVV